jgi:hypothetical protein
MNAINLFLDSNRGVYIPQHFAEMIDVADWLGITPEHITTLRAGPYHEGYWDTWNHVLDHASTDLGGCIYRLHHDGDLFLISYELMSPEDITEFME